MGKTAIFEAISSKMAAKVNFFGKRKFLKKVLSRNPEIRDLGNAKWF